MKTGLLYLLLLFFPLLTMGQAPSCAATLNGKVLSIQNDQLRLMYNLGDGWDSLIAYQLAGNEKQQISTLQNINLFNDKPVLVDASFKTEFKRDFPTEHEFLEVSVIFKVKDLLVKRVWKMYPGVAAIANHYELKGDANNLISATQKPGSTALVEDIALLEANDKSPYFGAFPLNKEHWTAKVMSFDDATDHHNNLVKETSLLPYHKADSYQGNLLLLTNKLANRGLFILKSSPSGRSQQAYPGRDFVIDHKQVLITGFGLSAADVNEGGWAKTYSYVLGFSDASRVGQLSILRLWQKQLRKLNSARDEMIMSNTWGDRSKDAKMSEQFILGELVAAAKLGITHFQLDDGWQQGLSKNSANKAGVRWDRWEPEDWKPHKVRFPNGFENIVRRAKELNISLGLWFNPGSNNQYSDWKTNAEILIGYYQKYNIKVFKIDGIDLVDKESEINIQHFFEYVMHATKGDVVFNLDVTAGKRGGYHYFSQYGNIFLENRYTDWANYYPHYTLRNLWQLSAYVPLERIQGEWLNTWRNRDKYPISDVLAPGNIPWEYQAATTFAAQPLAWMEISSLPTEAFTLAPLLKAYSVMQNSLHQKIILPIGDEPDGTSWTGFHAIGDKEGYFLIYRERNDKAKHSVKTYLKPNTTVEVRSMFGNGKSFKTKVGADGCLEFELPKPFSFGVYRYVESR